MALSPSDLAQPSSRARTAPVRPPKWTQPPLKAIPENGFTADNEAAECQPFDINKIETVRNRIGLGLTYRVNGDAKAELRLPAPGAISVLPRPLDRHTIALDLSAQVREVLHLAGRGADAPLPDPLSEYPFGGLDTYRGLVWRTWDMGGSVETVRAGRIVPLRARILISTDSADVEQRWYDGLADLLTGGAIKRDGPDGYETWWQDGKSRWKAAPSGEPPLCYLESWWNGFSIDPFRLVTADPDQALLCQLAADEAVTLHAQVRGESGRWYACNVGYVLRALGVAGDPADRDNDLAYLTLAGGVMPGGTRVPGALALVSSGVDVVDDHEVLPPADGLVVLSGGSRDTVFLNPRPGEPVPATLFSFTSADDIRVSSLRLPGTNLALRLWQPTFSPMDLAFLRESVRAGRGAPADVPVSTVPGPILATEYGVYAGRLPVRRLTRVGFLNMAETSYGYDGGRARPPADQDPAVEGAGGTPHIVVNLNAHDRLRPEHPPWKGGAEHRGAQLRRLFPLLLEGRLPEATGTDWTFLIGQDEIDCARQEYVFHLYWAQDPSTDKGFYQTYRDYWTKQVERQNNIHPNPDDPYRVGVAKVGNLWRRVPALGWSYQFTVPTPMEIRPVTERSPATEGPDNALPGEGPENRRAAAEDDVPENLAIGLVRYRYTRMVYNASRLKQTILDGTDASGSDGMAPVVVATRAMLAALDNGNANPAQGDLHRVDYRAIKRIHHLVTAQQTAPISAFLRRQLLAVQTRDRIAPDLLHLDNLLHPNSEWRPPEHNETVSTTPLSNHQLGYAMDLSPRTFTTRLGQGERNPLAMMALYRSAQQLWSASPRPLSEMLMECGNTQYLIYGFDFIRVSDTVDELDYLIQPVLNPATNKYGYRLADADGAPAPAREGRPIPAQDVTAKTRLRSPLVNAFHVAFSASQNSPAGVLVAMPPPTVLDVFVFALCTASHVHFTWTPAVAA